MPEFLLRKSFPLVRIGTFQFYAISKGSCGSRILFSVLMSEMFKLAQNSANINGGMKY